MKNYLSELLTEEPITQETAKHELDNRAHSSVVENQRLETLLKNVNAEIEVNESVAISQKNSGEQAKHKTIKGVEESLSTPLVTHKSTGNIVSKSKKAYRQGDFQALFFNVGGLTIAVPLIELGGIHKIEKTTSLMGKPDWFKGVMLYRDEKINVVDTALWVMPEKCDEKLKSSLNYQYVIMLSDSVWGLSAENLVDTVVLQQDEVKWLDLPSKRPWLAGLVKKKMCALLDVEALIQLLSDGSGINQLD
ncbi:MAG: chemotaxis protein CheW [Colwellia sp.]|nr:chemotaxis protein CheW [Colwellia sp.]